MYTRDTYSLWEVCILAMSVIWRSNYSIFINWILSLILNNCRKKIQIFTFIFVIAITVSSGQWIALLYFLFLFLFLFVSKWRITFFSPSKIRAMSNLPQTCTLINHKRSRVNRQDRPKSKAKLPAGKRHSRPRGGGSVTAHGHAHHSTFLYCPHPSQLPSSPATWHCSSINRSQEDLSKVIW